MNNCIYTFNIICFISLNQAEGGACINPEKRQSGRGTQPEAEEFSEQKDSATKLRTAQYRPRINSPLAILSEWGDYFRVSSHNAVSSKC